MIMEPVIYAPSMRWRFIRVGVPVLILLTAVTAYVLLNAATFERNADPDSISIPAFVVLLWVAVSVLAFVPLLAIGGSQLVVTPTGFAFGGRLKGVYLKVEGAWRDVLSAGYEGVELRTGGAYVHRAIFGLRVRQPGGEQFISLHHYRDQLRVGGRLAEHLRQVAPAVYAAIAEALTAKMSVPVAGGANAAAAPEAGRHSAEVQAYRRALEITPDDHQQYFYLANALIQSGQPGEAIHVMQQGLRKRPTSSALAFNIARTAKSLGQAEQARDYFERALTLAAQDPDLADRDAFIHQLRTEMGQP